MMPRLHRSACRNRFLLHNPHQEYPAQSPSDSQMETVGVLPRREGKGCNKDYLSSGDSKDHYPLLIRTAFLWDALGTIVLDFQEVFKTVGVV